MNFLLFCPFNEQSIKDIKHKISLLKPSSSFGNEHCHNLTCVNILIPELIKLFNSPYLASQ